MKETMGPKGAGCSVLIQKEKIVKGGGEDEKNELILTDEWIKSDGKDTYDGSEKNSDEEDEEGNRGRIKRISKKKTNKLRWEGDE